MAQEFAPWATILGSLIAAIALIFTARSTLSSSRDSAFRAILQIFAEFEGLVASLQNTTGEQNTLILQRITNYAENLCLFSRRRMISGTVREAATELVEGYLSFFEDDEQMEALLQQFSNSGMQHKEYAELRWFARKHRRAIRERRAARQGAAPR